MDLVGHVEACGHESLHAPKSCAPLGTNSMHITLNISKPKIGLSATNSDVWRIHRSNPVFVPPPKSRKIVTGWRGGTKRQPIVLYELPSSRSWWSRYPCTSKYHPWGRTFLWQCIHSGLTTQYRTRSKLSGCLDGCNLTAPRPPSGMRSNNLRQWLNKAHK